MLSKHHPDRSNQIGTREGIPPSCMSTDLHLYSYRTAIHTTALEAWHAGISVVPVLPDGRKRPGVRWRIYQQRLATLEEIACWFGGEERGLALITGVVSGGLEALDFDTHAIYQAWSERVRQLGHGTLYDRLTHGYLEATPNGMHLFYRSCAGEKNQKLARVPLAGSQHVRTLIETRGEGGLVVVAPSGGGVHPSGKPYVLLVGGLSTIPIITTHERQTLFAVARSFDQIPQKDASSRARQQAKGDRAGTPRPGDSFNRRASWEDVLEPHGWRRLYTHQGESYWQRPGKEGPGVSATTNYHGSDLLYVFSTSTVFEAGRAYSKFAAYAMLEHGGDFSEAARTLARRGYAENVSVNG